LIRCTNYLYVGSDPSLSSKETKKSQRDRAVLQSNVDSHRLDCAVPGCVFPSHDNCPRCKENLCSDHFDDDHNCNQFDDNNSFESNSASNHITDAPTIPPTNVPTNAPKLSPKHLKALIKSCLSQFKFFGHRTTKNCCQIVESSDVINFPIGAVISEINGEIVHDYNSNQLHYVLSKCPTSSIFKVHIYMSSCIYIITYI
jgi:hypothetical protein